MSSTNRAARPSSPFSRIGAIAAASVLGVSIMAGSSILGNKKSEIAVAAPAPAVKADMASLQEGFAQVAETVEPAVVSISAEQKVTTRNSMPEIFEGWPFGNMQPQAPRTQRRKVGGSGVIVRADGYILTNDHVVGGMENVEVKLKDGRKFPGKVLRDFATDLSLIKINATGLPVAKLADSAKVKPGMWAIAIGSPFGLSNTLTVGVVSALERENFVPDPEMGERGGRYYASLIQTDAAINPGNSGGPLLNMNGEVIGINVMIESPSGASAGIGFAIPSNTAGWVMEQLISKGKVERGFLGINPEDVDPEAAKRYGIEKGALVTAVTDDSPAGKAGIQVEDVIVSVNGKPINSAIELRETVAHTAPGTKVPIVVLREGKRQTINVTLGTPPNQMVGENNEDSAQPGDLGLTVKGITSDLRSQYGIDEGVKGVVVTRVDPDSAAARSGIQPGNVITRIDGKPVTSVQQFDAATDGLKAGDTAVVVVRTKDGTRAVDVTLPKN